MKQLYSAIFLLIGAAVFAQADDSSWIAEAEMKSAAGALDFERAAQLRDELLTLRELAKG